jgi:hypothetical protein
VDDQGITNMVEWLKKIYAQFWFKTYW